MFNAFGNATQVPPTRWRDEPATRGTWNILSTCLITLGLCLWTALHLNIPRHKEGTWGPKLRKTRWLLLGLLAPEMLAYTAWYQHRAAQKLDTVMRRKLGQCKDHTYTQTLAAFFRRCCRSDKRKSQRKQGVSDETSAVELDEQEANNVEHGNSDRSSGAASRRQPWTMAHSFYAIMGGFVFDTSNEDVNFLPNSRQRLTLTPSGLLYILEHEPDLIPNISEEYICDKSKASNLAKTLVCLQALWFCVQCLTRLGQGLAVSLLELNVFGHATCALLMYLLWWDKPLDIEEPTLLRGNRVREICALMCMRSFPAALPYREMSFPELPYGVRYGSSRRRNIAQASVMPDEDDEDDGKIKWYRLDKIVASAAIDAWNDFVFGRKPPLRHLECRLDWTAKGSVDAQSERFCRCIGYPVDLDYTDDNVGPKDGTASPALPLASAVVVDNSLHAQPIPPGPSITANRIGIDGFCLTLGRWPQEKNSDSIIKADVFVPRRPQPDYAPASVTLSHADVIRWQLCARALQRNCPQPRWLLISGAPSHQDFPAYRSVCERSPNWPSSQHLEFTEEKSDQLFPIWLGFSFAGLVYGGLHLLAWNAPFPSRVENKLWRGSGILLASSGFIFPLSILLYAPFILGYECIVHTSVWQVLKTRLGHWYKPLANVVSSVGWVVYGYLVISFALVYLLARGYLVVESFLQLVHLPDSAYALPRWSQYFPHIT